MTLSFWISIHIELVFLETLGVSYYMQLLLKNIQQDEQDVEKS